MFGITGLYVQHKPLYDIKPKQLIRRLRSAQQILAIIHKNIESKAVNDRS